MSEDEGIPDYKIGGYHPVHVGEIMINRYVIVQKLGWGHFSTVWLARDNMYNTYVALKVQKSASHYTEAAYDEVEILDVVAKNAHLADWIQSVNKYKIDDKMYQEKGGYSIEDCHTVQLLNSFIHSGPNGQHFIMVFEILGVNLLEIMKRYDYKGIPLPIVRTMTKQVLIGLDYLHRKCRIIHTDLKPENVIVALNKSQLKEIHDSGSISSMNKTERTLSVIQDILGKTQPLLAGVDTTGMSKLQKKKLKKKLLKQKNATNGVNQDDEEDEDDTPSKSGAKTAREGTKKPVEKAAESDEDDLEVPRSQSLPIMKWIEPRASDPEEDDLLDEPPSEDGKWELTLKRDFNTEI